MANSDGPKRKNTKSKQRKPHGSKKRKSGSPAAMSGMDRRRNKHWSW